jgi:D-sedoheptulose 7-phosphate isomerase
MDLSDLIEDVFDADHVYLCGNGGSAANAIHIANDLISVGVRAQALTADIATVTAIANDFGYENIFSRQLMVFGKPGDVLIALSGSGNSPNILRALETANTIGMMDWAILGHPGGQAAGLASRTFIIGNTMQSAEESQIKIGHSIMLSIKRKTSCVS